jgi:hypothetical protein
MLRRGTISGARCVDRCGCGIRLTSKVTEHGTGTRARGGEWGHADGSVWCGS